MSVLFYRSIRWCHKEPTNHQLLSCFSQVCPTPVSDCYSCVNKIGHLPKAAVLGKHSSPILSSTRKPWRSSAHPLFFTLPWSKTFVFFHEKFLQKVKRLRLGGQKVPLFSYRQNSKYPHTKVVFFVTWAFAFGRLFKRSFGRLKTAGFFTKRELACDVSERWCVCGDGGLWIPGKETGEAAARGREHGWDSTDGQTHTASTFTQSGG